MKTLFLYLFIFLSILHNQTIIEQNQKTLVFFMNQLLPSLFILCVFVQLIPIPSIKKQRKIKLFNIDLSSLFLIIKMILLGNPGNSYIINQFVLEKQISIQQAKRLIYCISIPSISFMLMTIPYLYNIEIAFILFIIHLLTIFILLVFTRHIPIYLNIHIKEKTLIEALLFSIKTMALILAYLFVVASIQSMLLIYFPKLNLLIHLLMEFSSGVSYFVHSNHPILYLLVCIGFGGFCAHIQIMSGCDEIKLNYFYYLFFRISHIFISLLIYFIVKSLFLFYLL